VTGIDLNRAGTPLVEIVSEPHLRSAKEAVAYMKKVHTLVRYLEICDGNMQEGSFRCDANVSVRRRGALKFGTRAEIKNLNSFRFVERAINYEVARQIDILESGGQVVQETRLYDADKGETRSMRSKEEANDYRYFPDPDLLPVVLDEAFISSVRATLPELPDQKAARFASQYRLSAYDAGTLTGSRELAAYYEEVVRELPLEPKLAANWVMGELAAALNKENLEVGSGKLPPARLAGLLRRICDQTISGKIAKEVFETMWSGGASADEVIDAQGLRQITDTAAIERVIDEVMARNPAQLAEYPRRQGQAVRIFRGPGHEGDRRQGQPGAAERAAAPKTRGLRAAIATAPRALIGQRRSGVELREWLPHCACNGSAHCPGERPGASLHIREAAGARPLGAPRGRLARTARACRLPAGGERAARSGGGPPRCSSPRLSSSAARSRSSCRATVRSACWWRSVRTTSACAP